MDLVKIASAALETGKFEDLGKALQLQRKRPDSFRILLSDKLSSVLSEQLGSDRVIDWIMRQQTWDVRSYGPQTKLEPAEKFLHLLWHDLTRRLRIKLAIASQHVSIASQGAVFCFFGRAELSIIVGYRRVLSDGFDLRPVTAVEQPHGVFELYPLLAEASPEQRNSIKAAALSTDKLIFQRGILVHVDRQREDVFGPTVDTVILADQLAQWLSSRHGASISALEVGAGNGLLCSLIANDDNVERLCAIDINPAAIGCTLKNLELNEITLNAVRPEISVRAERFRASQLTAPMDLIVCNPPYVPDPPSTSHESPSGYDLAVSGQELCKDLLASLESLLKPGGRLLLMTSSLSSGEVDRLVPQGFESHPVLEGKGYRVPLDLEVLWHRKDWRDKLLEQGCIEADPDENLFHYLQPVWITRREDAHP